MMRRKGSGHIIDIGAMSAQVRETGADIYVATKGAVEAMSESFRKTLAEENIKISLTEPAMVGTNLHGEPPDVQGQLQKEAEGEMLPQLTEEAASAGAERRRRR